MTSGSAVLLDIDGTLVDSTYHHAMAWHRAFARHGLTIPVWKIHRTIGMGGDKLVAHVAGDQAEAAHGDDVRDAWEEEYAAVVDDVPALPGAAELVSTLARDHAVGLASSGAARFSEVAIRTLGIGDLVDVVTSSDDADQSKPDPDILGATLDRLGSERAVVVGDTPYDVEAAARIGLRCVTVLCGGFSSAELESAGAALVAESPADLDDVDWAGLVSRPT